jgi:hypothetical protein
MTDLLAGLETKLTDRWLQALALPGLLFTGIAGYAMLAGQRHALDPAHVVLELRRVVHALKSLDTSVGGRSGLVFAIAITLLGAAAAGFAAQWLADAVHHAWTARGPLRWILRRRRRARNLLAHRRPRPPLRYLPARATPIGDRFRLIAQRVDAQYGLSIALAWPRLWLLLDETQSARLQATYGRYRTDLRLTSWGLMYLGFAAVWWPALLIAMIATTLGYLRGRTSSGVLADLIEATVDMHQQALAASVGIDLPHGRITPSEGIQINNILNKRA